MKFLFIVIVSLITSNALLSQNTYTEEEKKAIIEKAQQQHIKYQNRTALKKGTQEYNECYNKLLSLNTRMVTSSGYQKQLYLYKDFYKKLNQTIEGYLYRDQDAFFSWIDQNINSTEFRNAEAAKEDWLRLREAGKRTIAANPEYYSYINELSSTYENFSDLLVDVSVAVTKEQTK